jgi:type VI secretion system protein ImpH
MNTPQTPPLHGEQAASLVNAVDEAASNAAANAAAMAKLFDDLAAAPYAHDFFHVLRRIDALSFKSDTPTQPKRLGRALRPHLEPIRLGQDAELDFAPAAITSFSAQPHSPPRLGVRFFGLFGPQGALPLHVTEFARERERHHGDAGVARFADVFHHRALSLFYRAWAQAQPVVHLDRPGDDQFGKWLGALFGLGPTEFRHRDAVPDNAKRYQAGLLSQGVKNAEGLQMLLRQHFGVAVRIEMFVGHWLRLRPEDCTQLGSGLGQLGSQLGINAVAGTKVWSRQHKFRIHLGPLTRTEYDSFLPGSPSIAVLRDWVRQYMGLGMAWDVRLSLAAAEVPMAALQTPTLLTTPGTSKAISAPTRLGLSTWLGGAKQRDAGVDTNAEPRSRDDLCFGVEVLG